MRQEVEKLKNSIVDAQSELPFSFGVSDGGITYTSVGGVMQAQCDIEFDHEAAKRAAFWDKGKWDSGDLIYLFSNGYSFTSKHPPTGEWHGKRTVAKTSRTGNHFVRRAVEQYLSSAPSEVDVEIDGSYT